MQDVTVFISTHMTLCYTLALVLVLLMIIEVVRLKSMTYRIDVTQAIQLINRQQAKVIDIRNAEAFSQNHIIDADSLPANELTKQTKMLDKLKTRPAILVCTAGHESQKLAASLRKQGYNVYSLNGGMRAWLQAEMPTTKG